MFAGNHVIFTHTRVIYVIELPVMTYPIIDVALVSCFLVTKRRMYRARP